MPLGAFKLNTLSAAMAPATIWDSITTTAGVLPAWNDPANPTVVYRYLNVLNANYSWVVSAITGSPKVDIVLVGGGGAGGGTTSTGGGWVSGGGGAGQVIQVNDVPVTAQTYSFVVPSVVAGTTNAGTSGGNTTALGYTALGGGGGAGGSSPVAGSGGGGSGASSSTSYTATANSFPYKGGNSFGSATATSRSSGGGAGSSAVGGNGTSTVGGNGGAGTTIWSMSAQNGIGTTVVAGGGAGAGTTNGTPGTGNTGGIAGANNTSAGAGTSPGGGGGGTKTTSATSPSGGNGGYGAVYLRWQIPYHPPTMAYVNGSNTATVPSGVQAGDIIVSFQQAINSTTTIPTNVVPTGFTAYRSNTNTSTSQSARVTVCYKTAAGTESGTTLSGMTGTYGTQWVIAVYRPGYLAGAPMASQFYTGTINSTQVSDGVPTNLSFQLGTLGPRLIKPCIAFAYYSSTGSITSRGSSISATRELGGFNFYVKFFDYTSKTDTFADATISMGDYGNSNMQGIGAIEIIG
jgi:hypothetical protein